MNRATTPSLTLPRLRGRERWGLGAGRGGGARTDQRVGQGPDRRDFGRRVRFARSRAALARRGQGRPRGAVREPPESRRGDAQRDARRARPRPLYDNAAADRPMVLTATGYVPIEANAGGEGTHVGNAGANGQAANSAKPSVKPALGKASPDDPEHPGWPAGTPGGRGGKFRPKDAEGDNTSNNFTTAAQVSRPDTHYAALRTDTLTDASAGGNQHDTVDRPSDSLSDRYAQIDIPKYEETGTPLIDSTTRILFETLLRVHLLVGDGAGPLYGIRVHTLFAYDLKAQNLPGIDEMESSKALFQATQCLTGWTVVSERT
jgi:hypothetical protein